MISQTAEYALRAATYLLSRQGEIVSRREIAADTQISTAYLPRVMRALSDAGVVAAHRGPGGGYAIAADPQAVTVYDVVTAIEPIRRIEKCPLGLSDHEQLCPLHAQLDQLAESVERVLRQTRVIDLVTAAPGQVPTDLRCFFPPPAT